jgi:hypothetical protein
MRNLLRIRSGKEKSEPPMKPLTKSWMVMLLGLTACATSSITRVGAVRLESLPSTAEVVVFSSERDVGEPFNVLAILDYNNPGKYQILSLEDAVPKLKADARQVGANGIIIDTVNPVKSGFISTGIHVSARAIRVQSPP